MDLHRQFLILRRRWLLLLVGVVAAAVPAYLYTRAQPNVYEATATVAVDHLGGSDYNQLLVDQNLSADYAFRATTLPFLDKVAVTLPFDETAESLKGQISVTADQVAARLSISARDSDPDHAQKIANAVADAMVATTSQTDTQGATLAHASGLIRDAVVAAMQASQAEVARLSAIEILTPSQQAQLDAAWNRLAIYGSLMTNYVNLGAANGTPKLEVVQPALLPVAPVAPKPVLITLLAALVGLMAAAVILSFLEYSRHPVRDAQDAMDATGLPVLGAIRGDSSIRGIGRGSRLTMLLDHESPDTEAYRSLRANLGFAAAERPIHTLVVTGTTTRDGKTITACNLALAFAQVGRQVLLIDADLRQPSVHKQFQLTNGRGLSTLLVDPAASLVDVAHPLHDGKLHVLTSGPLPADPSALLVSTRMRALLAQLASNADLVIIDSPPMTTGSDGAILASNADAAILVVDAEHTGADTARRSSYDLQRARARVLGAVIYGSSSPGSVVADGDLEPPSVVSSRDRSAVNAHQQVDSA